MGVCPPCYGHAHELEGPERAIPTDVLHATDGDEVAGIMQGAAQLVGDGTWQRHISCMCVWRTYDLGEEAHTNERQEDAGQQHQRERREQQHRAPGHQILQPAVGVASHESPIVDQAQNEDEQDGQ